MFRKGFCCHAVLLATQLGHAFKFFLTANFLPFTTQPLTYTNVSSNLASSFKVNYRHSSGTVGAMMGLMKSKFLPAAPLKTKVHSDLAPSVDMVCILSISDT